MPSDSNQSELTPIEQLKLNIGLISRGATLVRRGALGCYRALIQMKMLKINQLLCCIGIKSK